MNLELRRATMWKRASAYLCDLILLATAAVGLALALSAIFGYDSYGAKLDEYYEKYATEYGIKIDITQEEYNALSDEQKQAYEAADKALKQDTEVIYTANMMSSLMLVILSLSILISYLLLEFIVPILFGNGQTLGKKVFGVAVMRTNSTKISTAVLFVRAILGKCTIETMVPVLCLMFLLGGTLGFAGIIGMLGLLILQICVVAFTQTRSAIHDLLSDCVTVDMASQRIFESEEEMIEYQNRLHAELVKKETY